MAVFDRFIRVVAAIALVAVYAGMGFLVCVLPPTTHSLANAYSDDMASPFNRTQLTAVADATRDYAFGSHRILSLYQAIYDVDSQYEQEVKAQGGSVDADFPDLSQVTDRDDPQQYARAFAGASDRFCYSAEEVKHLDDCQAIAAGAYPALAVILLVAVAGLVILGIRKNKRAIGEALMAAGISVLVCFLLLGAWALFDFNGMFAAFHALFFSQGSWTFPADSLLICALPEAFWVGMGTVWLAVALGASILSLAVGAILRLRAKKKKA